MKATLTQCLIIAHATILGAATPEFGVPVDAPEQPPGGELTLRTMGHENPYGPVTTIEGREAYTVLFTDKDPRFNGRYVYAKIPKGTIMPGDPVIISIIYYDDAPNSVRLRYDSNDETVDPKSAKFKEAGTFKMSGSGGWNMVEFKIDDGRFEGGCNGGDVRLEASKDQDFIINGIYVRPAE